MDYAKEVFKIEAQAIQELSQYLDDHFNQAIELILLTKGKLIITGMGKSGLIGRKMAATFSSTGTPSFFLHPAEAFHGDLGMVGKDDILLAISKSGETSEILQLIPFFKKQGLPIIAICAVADSTLAKNATHFLNVLVNQEACPLDLAPTASSTATLAMGDALAMALMKARNFQRADFAQFHPGGSLGKKLLTAVQSVMYEKDLPTIPSTTGMEGIINTMTTGKLGLVVVAENLQIIGIITDGDLRRVMKEKQAQFFQLQAKDFMTKNPITIASSTTINEAEALMIKHKITSLLVAEEGNLIGVVQIYQVA